MFKFLIINICKISAIPIFSYRITFIDFVVCVILIYVALQMYQGIFMFVASDINVITIDTTNITFYLTSTIISCITNDVYIPQNITPEIVKEQQVLIGIFNSIDKKSKTYLFLEKHCRHLLEPLENSTPHMFSEDSPVFYIENKVVAKEIGEKFLGKSMGIYMFCMDDKTLSTMYIGSSRSLTTRPLHHFIASMKPNASSTFYLFVKSIGGIQNMQYRVLYSAPSYTDIWYKENGAHPNQFTNSILMAFSSLHVGILEQGLLSKFDTGLNKSKVVKFPSSHWAIKYKVVPLYYNNDRSKSFITVENSTNFDFSMYYDYCEWKGTEPLSLDWLEYIIGFCEARGGWVKPWNKGGGLEFSMKEMQYLKILTDILGLSTTLNEEYNRLTISSLSDLEVFYSLFLPSGNLITDRFLVGFSNHVKSNSYGNLLISDNYTKGVVTLDSNWLSGYMDGYSMLYFTIISNTSVKGINVRPVVKITCSSNELAKNIQSLFPFSRISSKEPHIVQFTSVKAAQSIIQYLDSYPLRIKHDIQVWFKDILQRMLLGEHRSANPNVIESLKNLIKNRPELVDNYSPFLGSFI